MRCQLDAIKLEDDLAEPEPGSKCNGPVKPCITFFGQALPSKFFDAWLFIENDPQEKKFRNTHLRD